MISSLLAFLPALAAPKPAAVNPETDAKSSELLARALIDAKQEIADLSETLAAARHRGNALAIEIEAVRDMNAILERQREDLAAQIGAILDRERRSRDVHAREIARVMAMIPTPPVMMAVDPARRAALAGARPDRIIVDDPQAPPGFGVQLSAEEMARLEADSRAAYYAGFGQAQQMSEQLAQQAMTRSPELWPLGAPSLGYFDCTCVPARHDVLNRR